MRSVIALPQARMVRRDASVLLATVLADMRGIPRCQFSLNLSGRGVADLRSDTWLLFCPS
jgi:hypothetical protein